MIACSGCSFGSISLFFQKYQHVKGDLRKQNINILNSLSNENVGVGRGRGRGRGDGWSWVADRPN